VTFQQFWNMYLRGHSLPGTRVIHYFATVLGLLCALQAVVSHRPLFALGIAASYAVAIAAHRFIERNAPLIGVSVWWGIVADVRMSWLAVRGRLGAELERAGIEIKNDLNAEPSQPSTALKCLDATAAILGTLGLAWTISDLADLFEPKAGPDFDFVQLGVPIVAFWAATAAGFGAFALSSRQNAKSHQAAKMATSLRRASLALLVSGGVAFVAAEAVENGLFARPDFAMAAATGLVAAIVALALIVATRKSKTLDDSSATFGASICKLIGFLGSAAAAFLGSVTLCWQLAPLTDGGAWRHLPLADLIQSGTDLPAALAWLLQAPSSLSFFLASLIFFALGVRAAGRETKRRADTLFAQYLARTRDEASRGR